MSENIEKELQLYSLIINTLDEGVSLTQADGLTIVYTNPAFERMFGYSQNELIGKNVAILNSPTDQDHEMTANQIVGILKKTGKWQGEICNIKKDGTIFWCQAKISEFDHHEYGRVGISVNTDITELRKLSRNLREQQRS